jgi:hypothetical protein
MWTIAEITEEVGVNWKYCPSEENLADLWSRGASIDKMEKDGPERLVNPDKWPKQPKLERTKNVLTEQKPMTEVVLNAEEKGPDEWDLLLSISSYCKTLRVTVWALRFVSKCKSQKTAEN